MGRKPKYTSRTEKDLATRAWKARSNRTRKQRRALDPAYNAKVVMQSRLHYRKASGGVNVDRVKVCRESLQNLESIGSLRQLVIDGKPSGDPVWTMTTTQLAPAIGLCGPAVIHVWHGKGIFPRPVAKAATVTLHVGVYRKEEVEAMLPILAEHFSQKNYLTEKDAVTSAKLFRATGQVFVPKLKRKK